MSADPGQFLQDCRPRPVKLQGTPELRAIGLALGQGNAPLEVVITACSAEPPLPSLRTAWKNRHGGRPAPVLLVTLYRDALLGDRAALCGPAGEEPPAYLGVDPGQAERICREALQQPDRHAALRSLRDAIPAVDSKLPGVRNEGFLATHELATGARGLREWDEARQKSRGLLNQRGDVLLKALGYKVERCDQVTSILRASDERKLAVAVLLHQAESPDLSADRFNGLSPVSYAMSVADRENLPYVIVSQGAKLRLYPVKPSVGVGRRGRTETYVELHAGLLRDEDAAYLWLLFSSGALAVGGTVERLLETSRDFAGALAERLRERVYTLVVPQLAEGLVAARGKRKPSAQDLADTYEMAMTLLFRLLFIAYAEDRQLLPYRLNQLYRSRSLKAKARELLAVKQAGTHFDDGDALWREINLLFAAVEKGNESWGVPEYDGGLFATDPAVSRVGAELASVTLPDSVLGPALHDLLVINSPEGWGPVDFRSLGVREFGTIYEGLLESELSSAAQDLTLDREGYYRPAKDGDDIVVRRGKVYLHNRSGARKASGAYFTKQFAVEHLLDHALEPALVDHIARLDKLDDEAAATALFDFRVADIAMGSGHFLVAAIDRIERAFTQFLARRPLPGVRGELADLRVAAEEKLGVLADQIEIEDTQLLRRLIARRSIYGVDLNPVSVNLARLSIWIHTFVAGLPLSLLDHNLVVGNSLVGIGRLSEIQEMIEEKGRLAIFPSVDEELLGAAMKPLAQLASIADRTATEVRRARKAIEEAREAVAPAAALCEIAVACRFNDDRLRIYLEDWEEIGPGLPQSKMHRDAKKTVKKLPPFHFPIAFPEVFLRERSGFDVILGNPPWDKVRFEAQQFWVTRSPGLNALPSTKRDSAIERLREEKPEDAAQEQLELEQRETFQVYIDRAFQLQGKGRHGHHDLAKVFCERAMALLAPDGWLGYVLPRTALVLGGWTDIRETLIRNSVLTTLQARNKGGWLFDDIDHRIMVGLLTRKRFKNTVGERELRIWPSVASEEQLKRASDETSLCMSVTEIQELSETCVIPWFSSCDDRPLFDCMRSRPRLGHGKAWIKGVADSSRWDFSGSGPHSRFVSEKERAGCWRVLMTRHVDAYEITRDAEFQRHIARPLDLVGLQLGVIKRDQTAVVAPEHPIIVYRYPTMNDNSRTLIATVLEETGFLYSKGYAHGLRTEDADVPDVLALLGYLNTFIADWWVRRFTDRHMTLPVLSNLPLPDWKPEIRSQVADLVQAILYRKGARILPGKFELTELASFDRLSTIQLVARIERLSLTGFGLKASMINTILEDFSNGAVPAGFVDELLRPET